MSYRNKTYVALDYDTDCTSYNIMKAWHDNDHIDFDFNNVHDLNNIRPYSNDETIKRRLKERMNNSKNFILLLGEHTKQIQYDFVRWEIEQALSDGLPIIVCNLNGSKRYDADLCPAILKDKLAIHVPFKMLVIKRTLDDWPDIYNKKRVEGKSCPLTWTDEYYSSIGIY